MKRSLRKRGGIPKIGWHLFWIALALALGYSILDEAGLFAALGAGVFFGFAPASLLGFILVSLLTLPRALLLNRILSAVMLAVLGASLLRSVKKHRLFAYAAVFLLCGCLRFAFITEKAQILPSFRSLIISVVLFVALCWGMKCFFYRGITSKPTADERICLAITYLLAFTAVFRVSFGGVNVAAVVAIMLLHLSLYVFGVEAAFGIAVLSGMGAAIVSGNPVWIASFCIWHMVAAAFRTTGRIMPAFAVILSDILLAYATGFYTEYTYAHFITVSLGSVLSLCLSDRMLKGIRDRFTDKKKHLLTLVRQKEEQTLRRRLISLSGIFNEMQRVFVELASRTIKAEQAVQAYVKDFHERVCEGCPNKAYCSDVHSHVQDALTEFIATGLEKGRITLLDMPDLFAKRCAKTNLAMQVITQYCIGYRQFVNEAANQESARKLIAKEIAGVAQIFKKLSGAESDRGELCPELMQRVQDALLNEQLECYESVVFSSRKGYTVCVTMPPQDAVKAEVSKTVSRTLGVAMMVVEREATAKSNEIVVRLVPAPSYDVVFGACGMAKSGNRVSGDTHSLIQIGADRFLLALCDGMGSGEMAERASRNAISLIESFYKAGFESDLILESVNGLLACSCEEVFCALDIVVIDLSEGRADFIKLGAPPSVIRGEKMQVIAGNALPLGILEESKPSTESVRLQAGDMVVLTTDGITDAFVDVGAIKASVQRCVTVNPQELCEHLMSESLKAYGGKPKDDMTVVCLRIFSKNS
ncbi:MAG: SpoIIE family protein phosphatase [Clostridia bacterium]|nr:SpoIIE family protein phosphatase [Clostridia bacterium]